MAAQPLAEVRRSSAQATTSGFLGTGASGRQCPLEAGARRPAQSRRGSRLQGKHGVAFMVLQKVCCVRTKGAWPECWHRGQGATSWQPQTSMPVAVPDCDKCLDPRLLGGQDLLLQGHNLQNFILQGRPMRQVSDRLGEEINLLRADLPLARQPSVAAGIHSLTLTSPPWAPWPGSQPSEAPRGTPRPLLPGLWEAPRPPQRRHGLAFSVFPGKPASVFPSLLLPCRFPAPT